MNAYQFTSPPAPDDPSSFPWPSDQTTTHRWHPPHGKLGGRLDMQQSCDHQNLFLVGSGTFPTVGTANPTLTIAALCLRTADYVLRRVLS
jgi:choline dehydrogenase-like flavoprotein